MADNVRIDLADTAHEIRHQSAAQMSPNVPNYQYKNGARTPKLSR